MSSIFFSLSTLSLTYLLCRTFSASPKAFNISSASSSVGGEGTSSRTSSIFLTSFRSLFSKTASPDFVAQVVFAFLVPLGKEYRGGGDNGGAEGITG